MICPYLRDGRCTIYADRFKCCRAFPAGCLKQRCNSDCENCQDLCCERIDEPPRGVRLEDWLNMDCGECPYGKA